MVSQAALMLMSLLCSGMAMATASNGVSGKDEAEKKTDHKTGTASWYGKGFQGKRTANGETFDMNGLTCASNHYPLGTWLKVTNLKNGKTVVVKVNDRMHPRMKRLIDLSHSSAKLIGIDKTGIGKVRIEDLGKGFVSAFP